MGAEVVDFHAAAHAFHLIAGHTTTIFAHMVTAGTISN